MDSYVLRADDTAAFSEFQLETKEQAERRRTFAIISHLDAGKTTMTKRLLLFGGAIEEAPQFEAEYGVSTSIQMFDIKKVRRVCDGWNSLKTMTGRSGFSVAFDKIDDPVLLFRGKWDLEPFRELYPGVKLAGLDARSVEALVEVS